jgi:hypothetical protein
VGSGGALRLRKVYWEPETGDAVNIVHQVTDMEGSAGGLKRRTANSASHQTLLSLAQCTRCGGVGGGEGGGGL